MKTALHCMILWVSVINLYAIGFAGDERYALIEQMNQGSVDWSRGVIYATGTGRPGGGSAEVSAARTGFASANQDAQRNLETIVMDIRVDAGTSVRDVSLAKADIRLELQGIIRETQVENQAYRSDGTPEVTLQFVMHGGFAQLMLPGDIKQIEPIRPVGPVASPPASAESGVPLPGSGAKQWPYTGLIVDARGVEVRPALAPKIVDEDLKEIYGSAYVSREHAVHQGMCGYMRDIQAAQRDPRVANDPLTVKGLRTHGSGQCDLVISNADASRLRAVSEHLSFLRQCRVIIVVD